MTALHPDDVVAVSKVIIRELPAVPGYPVDGLSSKIITALNEACAERLPTDLQALVMGERGIAKYERKLGNEPVAQIMDSMIERLITQATALEAANARAEAAEKECERLCAVLMEISEGKGAFSIDHFQHCKNTVFDMKNLAKVSLGLEPDHD